MYLFKLLNVFVRIEKCIWFQIDYSIEAATFEVWLEIKWLDLNSTQRTPLARLIYAKYICLNC